MTCEHKQDCKFYDKDSVYCNKEYEELKCGKFKSWDKCINNKEKGK